MREIMKISKLEEKKGFNTDVKFLRVNDRINIFDEDLKSWFIENEGQTYEFDIIETKKGNKVYENIREKGFPIGTTPLDKMVEDKIIDFTADITAKPKIVAQNNSEKQNSRSYGTASDNVKIYYTDAEDLDKQIVRLLERELMPAAYFEAKKKFKEATHSTEKIEEAWKPQDKQDELK